MARPSPTPSAPPVVVVAPDALAGWQPPAGWTRRDGFDLPDRPWDLAPRRWVCTGAVTDSTGAAAALEAGGRGTGLAILVDLPASARLRFLEDLDKLVAQVGGEARSPERREPLVELSELEERLLALVAGGATLTAAAAEANVSRRTAHRAMARARTVLGAPTTTAAASRWSAARADLAPG